MDVLVIAGRPFTSRLIVGTGKYKNGEQTRCAIEASGAEIVTVAGPPTGVPAPAVTVNCTVTGVEAVGLTGPAGENTQAAPAGRPEGKLSVTVPAKLPSAVT